MPQIFKIGPYRIYFWSNEGEPLEPIHVHISEGEPSKDGTKIWITRTGKGLVSHNKSRIPERTLRNFVRFIDANSDEIKDRWLEQFGEISYFC